MPGNRENRAGAVTSARLKVHRRAEGPCRGDPLDGDKATRHPAPVAPGTGTDGLDPQQPYDFRLLCSGGGSHFALLPVVADVARTASTTR